MSKKLPNLLFFGIDSLRRDHMSHYGYPRLTTPHISKYAEGGVTFEECFSPHIPTTPGYANMMTGRDCFGTDVVALSQKHIIDGVPVLAEILREKGMDERLVHAVVSHGYLLTVDVQPEHQMEKVLYATDELTGLIGAVVRMLPTKSVQDLQLKSLKKKFKDKKFAAGCSREVIERGADMLGWSLDELMERTINAMQASPAANGN